MHLLVMHQLALLCCPFLTADLHPHLTSEPTLQGAPLLVTLVAQPALVFDVMRHWLEQLSSRTQLRLRQQGVPHHLLLVSAWPIC